METEINMNVDDVLGELNAVSLKQVPWALSQTVNELAFSYVKPDLIHEMKDVFDNPTPYTLRGLYVRKGSKKKPTATVGFKNESTKAVPQSKYMMPQVEGGGRGFKRFEIALRSKGVLPSGFFVVPGSGAKLDPWGNINRGQIIKILSYFQTFGMSGFRANSTDKTKTRMRKGRKLKGVQQYGMSYFVVKPGDVSERRRKLHPGIYQKTYTGFGAAIKPVMIFVSKVNYDSTLDFDYVTELSVNKYFPAVFDRWFKKAMETAK